MFLILLIGKHDRSCHSEPFLCSLMHCRGWPLGYTFHTPRLPQFWMWSDNSNIVGIASVEERQKPGYLSSSFSSPFSPSIFTTCYISNIQFQLPSKRQVSCYIFWVKWTLYSSSFAPSFCLSGLGFLVTFCWSSSIETLLSPFLVS